MRNIKIDLGAQQPQAAEQDGRGGHAIGVVVAIDGNLPFRLDGVIDNLSSIGCAGQEIGIAQPVELRIEKSLHVFQFANAPREQQLRDNRRDACGLLQSIDASLVVGRNTPAFGHVVLDLRREF